MSQIRVDFARTAGDIKPMHAVNNGPLREKPLLTRGNFAAWKEAGIPYARNHDAAFYWEYGGEHIVDIQAIFPHFDADVEDPASYDFALTDEYLQTTLEAGTKIFYRLGSKIEHWSKKYGTLPPKDFAKWARICEHIIRHYNEGWANGFYWNIEYWEIWNEPDGSPDDSPNKLTWGGTKAEFFELYRITALHLKHCFPHLKIGGPAVSTGTTEWTDEFLAAMAQGERVPLDFFSWHKYCALQPEGMLEAAAIVREKLDTAGYTATESILNEWNYILNFDTRYVESIQTIISQKGAAYTAACMLALQHSSVDMLMYYDARPCEFNGLFDFYTMRPLKGYYPFKMFNTLYTLGTSVICDSTVPHIYAAAAKDEAGNSAVMLCYYDNDGALPTETVQLSLGGGAAAYEILLLDDTHDMTAIGTVSANSELTLSPNTVMLLKSRI